MSVRIAKQNTEKWVLVHWPEEDSTTVVLEKILLLSEEKLCRGSDVGDECVIKHIPTHKGKIAAIGSKDEMEKLSDMFIKGQYTPFSDQPSNKKHLLSDSTNGKPAKKRKLQLTTRKEKEKKKVSGKENQKKGKKEKKKGSILEVTLQPSYISDDPPRETDPVSPRKTTPSLSSAKNQLTLLPHSSERETDPVSPQKTTPSLSPAKNQPTLLPHSSEHEAEHSNSLAEEEVHVAASKPTPSTQSDLIDLHLLESTVSSLEESVLRIQRTQSKILDNQNQIFDNQNQIFQRLCDLEKHTSVPFASRVQSANMKVPRSASNHLSMPPSPSPNWYVDDSDSVHTSLPAASQTPSTHHSSTAPQMSAPQTPTTHHRSTAPQILAQNTPQVSVLTEPQTPSTPHPSTTPQVLVSAAPQTPTTHHPSTAPQILAQNTSQPAAIIAATKGEKKTLDSSCINKSKLIPVDMVVAKYPKLRTVSKASTLAVKLAKESVFGEDVMRQCTVHGTRQLPGLPAKELFQLKKAVFDQFPEFWSHPPQFESVWKECGTSINQSCKSLRTNKPLLIE